MIWFENNEEMIKVAELIRKRDRSDDRKYWIGAVKRDGKYRWNNGEPFTYTNWGKG